MPGSCAPGKEMERLRDRGRAIGGSLRARGLVQNQGAARSRQRGSPTPTEPTVPRAGRGDQPPAPAADRSCQTLSLLRGLQGQVNASAVFESLEL